MVEDFKSHKFSHLVTLACKKGVGSLVSGKTYVGTHSKVPTTTFSGLFRKLLMKALFTARRGFSAGGGGGAFASSTSVRAKGRYIYETGRHCLGQRSCEPEGELEIYELVVSELTLQPELHLAVH